MEKTFKTAEEAAVYFAGNLPWNVLPECSAYPEIEIFNLLHRASKENQIKDILYRLKTIRKKEINAVDSEFFRDSLEHFLHLKYSGSSSFIVQSEKEGSWYDEFLGYAKKENSSFVVKFEYPNSLTGRCPCSSPSEFCREIDEYEKSKKENLTLEKIKTEMKLPNYVANLLTERI